MKRAVLYARVSTSNHCQTTENQLVALREVCQHQGWRIVQELSDEVSGSKGREDRTGFDALLKGITRGSYDVVLSWSIDRLGRSITHLVDFMNHLNSSHVDLYVHQQAVNTATPAGRMVFGIFAALGEYERELIKSRIHAGLHRARLEGKRLGRPTNVNEAVKTSVKVLREQGWSLHKIAKELHIGVQTTAKILAAA
jgi:DNA invertase Pin-like site-specific DNA recombinase